MANGDGGEFAHFLMGPDGQWHQIARLSDEISEAAFGTDGYLYLLSHRNALKGKILRVSLAQPLISGAQTVVPESRVAIQSFLPIANTLYVWDQIGGPSQIRIFDTSEKAQGLVPIPPVSAVNQILRSDADQLFFNGSTHLRAASRYR